MSNEFKIEVHKRDIASKKSSLKSLRNDDKIPGIYYSFDSSNSSPLYIDSQSLNKAIKSKSKIFNIAVGKENKNVIFKSIQYHPITDKVLHVDLYGVDMKRAVTVKVAIILKGSAIGVVEEGGVIVQSLNELEIECLPQDIPDTFEVDITTLAIGDSIKVNEITIDDKFVLKTFSDQTVASVTHAMKEEEPLVVEEELDDEFIEGESEEGEEGEDKSVDEKTDDSSENKES